MLKASLWSVGESLASKRRPTLRPSRNPAGTGQLSCFSRIARTFSRIGRETWPRFHLAIATVEATAGSVQPSATFRHRDVRRPPGWVGPDAGERGNQRSLAAVDVCAVVDREDRHGGAVVIDAIQHAVRAAAGAEHAG